MYMPDFFSIAPDQPIVTCPNCGGDHYESNRFDETLLRSQARDVPMLLFDGKPEKAREILTALHRLHIENLIRPEFFCLSCGVTFDA